jgi:hypothetical protein
MVRKVNIAASVQAYHTFIDILDSCRGNQSSDPRDKVYGLLGLAPRELIARMEVDYLRSTEQADPRP